MRILLSILSICVLGGCVEVPLKKTKCEDQLTGTASIRDKNEFNEFVLIARRGDSVTNISFCGPKQQIFKTDTITKYKQETKKAGRPQWSGGGFEEGFIYINRIFKPYYVEIHAIERGDCSCRHLFPYFANGRYYIK